MVRGICSFTLVLLCVAPLPAEQPFVRGDADGNGVFNGLVDGLFILAFQFVPGSPAPPCLKAADVDDDGVFNGLNDALYELSFQFITGSPRIPLPSPDCGLDPTPDTLPCEAFPPCPSPTPWDASWDHTLGEQNPPCAHHDGCLSPMCPRCTTTVGPVIVHSGEVAFSWAPPAGRIPARGDVDWSMPLVYRSAIDFSGCVGANINLRYVTDRLRPAAGGIRRFDAAGGRFDTFDGSTHTARGLFQILGDDLDGTVTVRRRDGLVTKYLPLDGATNSGRLRSIRDRRGNVVTVNHDSGGRVTEVIDSMGRRIEYVYDDFDRLQEIRDFYDRDLDLSTGEPRVTRLAFNDLDQLVGITLPVVTHTPQDDDGIDSNGPAGNDFPDGKSFSLRYDSESPDPLLRDNLLGVTYPNEVATSGPERYTFTYGSDPGDPLTYDRVVLMTIGGGQIGFDPVGGRSSQVPAGGAYSFTYEDLASPMPGTDLTTEVRKTTVLDANGNATEYYFNANYHEVRRVVLTNRDVNPRDPESFTTLKTWNVDCQLESVTYPEGNRVEFRYDTSNVNRFSQGNLVEERRIPDSARGGDQNELRTSYTYEPIFNLRRTVTTARGNDPAFVPPIPDAIKNVRPIDLNLDGDADDPEDGETARRLRYTAVDTFDYQEGSAQAILDLAVSEGVTLDLDGPGPLEALTAAEALSVGGPTALDLNGDGTTGQQSGNVIETRAPLVSLPDGTAQEVVVTSTFNGFGDLTSQADAEGNLTTVYYFPEADPDGNGLSEGLARAADLSTGGWRRLVVRDDDPALAANPALDPQRPPDQAVTNAGTSRRTRLAPFVVERSAFTYDPVGNVTSLVDGRGIRTVFVVNSLNEVVETIRAAEHDVLPPDPPEPLALVDFQFRERISYDFNGNVIRRQVEDRGNTSQVGGNNAAIPFVDTIHKYDLLDQRIETRAEVSDTEQLITRRRYDPNGNEVLIIRPEGNAFSRVFDERDLVFQNTRGAIIPPALVRLSSVDSTDYDIRGGEPSTQTFHYDGNGNRVESVDGADTDASSGNNSTIGFGDRTRHLHDGFDRHTSTVDAVGNQLLVQYDPDNNAVRTCRFGSVGGVSPTSDGPDPLPRPVSDAGVIAGGNLVGQSLLAATETLHDELGRTFQVDRLLFLNTIPMLRPVDVSDGATDIGGGNLTPGDNEPIPGLDATAILGRVSGRTNYDRNSLPVEITEDDLDTTTHEYDGLDRNTRTLDAEGNSREMAYDDNNNVIEVRETDVSQVLDVEDEIFVTTLFYDTMNRLQRRVDNLGQSVERRYDSRGNLVATADAMGPLSGRAISRRAFSGGPLTVNEVNDPGNVVLWAYDGILRQISEDGVLTEDGCGDGVIGVSLEGIRQSPQGSRDIPSVLSPDEAQSADGVMTRRCDWDGNSLIDVTTDDLGNRTQHVYDNLDRRVATIRGECSAPSLSDQCDPPTTTVFKLDPDDNVVRVTDENGSITDFEYDAHNRRIAFTVTRAPGVVGTTAVSVEYDGLSRETLATDNNDPDDPADDSVITRAYDSLSRQVEETQQLGDGDPRVISSGWRAENLRSSLIFPNNRVIAYTFDRLNRTRTIAGEDPIPIAMYDYVGRNRVLERSHPGNGTRLTFLDELRSVDTGYDGLRRPVQLQHRRVDKSLIVGFTHGYDRMNQPLHEGKLHDGANDEVYARDSGYRLVSCERPNDGGVDPFFSNWNLDGVGNWIQVDRESRWHSSFNEITVRDNGTPVPILSDDNGNLVDDGTFAYAWDHANRLRTVTRKSDGVVVATHTYDALGRRARQVTSANPPSVFARNPRLPVSDTLPEASDSINILDSGVIDDLDCAVEITHSFIGELFIVFTSPNATSVILHEAGGGEADDIDLVYDDEGVPNGSKPYDSGVNMQPTGPGSMSAFEGEDRRGEWNLTVFDFSPGNDGVFEAWRLILSEPGATISKSYYYDEEFIIEERDATDGLSHQYVYGGSLELVVIDRNLDGDSDAAGRSDQRLFYHQNVLGHVYGLTNTTGVLIEGYRYDPYGQSAVYLGGANGKVDFGGDDLIRGDSNVKNPYRFAGMEFDSETGLYHSKIRFYSSDLGRFISRDGELGTTNAYEYASSNPGGETWFPRESVIVRIMVAPEERSAETASGSPPSPNCPTIVTLNPNPFEGVGMMNTGDTNRLRDSVLLDDIRRALAPPTRDYSRGSTRMALPPRGEYVSAVQKKIRAKQYARSSKRRSCPKPVPEPRDGFGLTTRDYADLMHAVSEAFRAPVTYNGGGEVVRIEGGIYFGWDLSNRAEGNEENQAAGISTSRTIRLHPKTTSRPRLDCVGRAVLQVYHEVQYWRLFAR